MKNYKFRLEALLKLRKLKEHQQKIELAKINKKISVIDNKVLEARDDIKTAYTAMEETLKDGSDGQFAQFFPMYIKGKRAFIENSMKERELLVQEYEKCRQVLNQKRGDVKVVQNMKEKDFEQERKKYLKKLDATIEDIIQAQRSHKKRAEKGA